MQRSHAAGCLRLLWGENSEFEKLVSKEEQRYGRNKGTTVDHTYIQSEEYRKKFDKSGTNGKSPQ